MKRNLLKFYNWIIYFIQLIGIIVIFRFYGFVAGLGWTFVLILTIILNQQTKIIDTAREIIFKYDQLSTNLLNKTKPTDTDDILD
jgi:hypothetical protein